MMRLSTLWRVDSTVGADGGSPVAEAILAHWTDACGTARFFRSSSNFLYRCQYAGQPHFLRCAASTERTRATIEAEVDLLLWLAAAGIPVAVPVQSLAGNRIETVETAGGTFHAVLFPALAGEQRQVEDLDEAGFGRWGVALGRLHAITSTYAGASAAARPTWHDLLGFIAQQLPDAAPALHGEFAALEASLAALPTTPATYGLCHFDLELDNLLWQADRVGIIDFDDCAHLWYAADLTLALGDFFATGAGIADPRFGAFVAGYRQEHALDDAALDQIPLFLRFADLYDYARLRRATDLAITAEHPVWLARLNDRFCTWMTTYQASLGATSA